MYMSCLRLDLLFSVVVAVADAVAAAMDRPLLLGKYMVVEVEVEVDHTFCLVLVGSSESSVAGFIMMFDLLLLIGWSI